MQQIADRSAVGRARAANGTHCSRHAGGGTHFPRSCTGARSISYRVGTKRVPSAPKPQNLGLENSKQLQTPHTKRARTAPNKQPTNQRRCHFDREETVNAGAMPTAGSARSSGGGRAKFQASKAIPATQNPLHQNSRGLWV